jgi:hypothetical protein
VVTLHNLPTYVAEPSEGRISEGIVVIIPDAFGWEFVNNRLMVDEYARSGDLTVFLPDFMNGMYFLVTSTEALACLTIRSTIIHTLKHVEAWPRKSAFIYHRYRDPETYTNLQILILGNSCPLWVIEPLDTVMRTESLIGYFKKL